MDDTSADDDAAIRAELAKTGRAYIRVRKALPEVIRKAGAAGMGFAEIARATGHAVTPERVRQILKPKPAE